MSDVSKLNFGDNGGDRNVKDAVAREKLTVVDPTAGEGLITFGVDANGNYGYKKVGADTVTPFKTGGDTEHDEIMWIDSVTASGETDATHLRVFALRYKNKRVYIDVDSANTVRIIWNEYNGLETVLSDYGSFNLSEANTKLNDFLSSIGIHITIRTITSTYFCLRFYFDFNMKYQPTTNNNGIVTSNTYTYTKNRYIVGITSVTTYDPLTVASSATNYGTGTGSRYALLYTYKTS